MSSSAVKRILPSTTRVLVSAVLLSALFTACLYLYHTAFPFFHDHLVESEWHTLAWLWLQLSFSLPFIVIGLFFTIAYRGMDRRDGVASREKMWIAILVTVFTYGILLPYLNGLSHEMYAAAVEAGAEIPETDGGVPLTLMMQLHDWFIRLSIPMALIMGFYAVRSDRERKHPDEPDEPLLTVDEYNARMATAPAEETAAPAGLNEEVTHG